MKHILTFALLFGAVYANAQLEINFKYGLLFGQNKKMDHYILYDNRLRGEVKAPINVYGIAANYYFTKNIYSGLQFDYYRMLTNRIFEIKIIESKYVEQERYENTGFNLPSLSRNRLNATLFMGFKIKYGFYFEFGATYMKNYNNQLGNGYKYDNFQGFGRDIVVKLDTVKFENSHNLAGVIGMGWKIRTKRGLCVTFDYKRFYEQPTKFEDDSDFALLYRTQTLSFGVGYYFDLKKKAKRDKKK